MRRKKNQSRCGFACMTVVMLILLYFLLAYDGVFLTKIIRITPRLGDKKRAVSIMRAMKVNRLNDFLLI